MHVPAWHVSPVVQALPSSQELPLALRGLEQTPPEQVPAVWHWSSAVHVTGVPLVQVPAWHVSPVVQALPSSQVVPLAFVGLEQTPPEQVPAEWHWSSAVHVMGFPPTQVPPEHVSVCVQAFPSLHAIELFWFRQPVLALAPMLPGLHVSVVQVLLSLHAALFAVLLQTPDELQVSVVHDLPSSQLALQQNPPAQSPAVPFANTQSLLTEHAEPGPLL